MAKGWACSNCPSKIGVRKWKGIKQPLCHGCRDAIRPAPKVRRCNKCCGVQKVRKWKYSQERLCKFCRDIRSRIFPYGIPGRTKDQVRRRYGKYRLRSRTGKLPRFHVLYKKFQSGLSFKLIALEYGLTKERISQVYEGYFSGLFPGQPDGNTRIITKTAYQHGEALS